MPFRRNSCIPRAVVSTPALRTFAALLTLAASTAALAQQDFGAPTAQPPQYPQQPSAPAPQSPPLSATGVPGYGNAPPAAGAGANALQMLVQQERQDFGVPPQQTLQPRMHGPTPTSIPGGQVITTDRLIPMLAQGPQQSPLVFHVLGPGDMLPGAQMATPASQAGTFDDQTQREFGQYLQQVTHGDKAKPLVFYCLNTQCWMSYNAALRAINMGFSQVMWYRGGIEAWQQAQQMAAGMQTPNGVR